jgi:acyl-CoA hydrolase
MGKTERERAKELIAVAHPDYRADLKAAMDKALGIGRSIFLMDDTSAQADAATSTEAAESGA